MSNNLSIIVISCLLTIFLTTRRLGKPKKKKRAAVIKVKAYKAAKAPPKTKSQPAIKPVQV